MENTIAVAGKFVINLMCCLYPPQVTQNTRDLGIILLEVLMLINSLVSSMVSLSLQPHMLVESFLKYRFV